MSVDPSSYYVMYHVWIAKNISRMYARWLGHPISTTGIRVMGSFVLDRGRIILEDLVVVLLGGPCTWTIEEGEGWENNCL